MPTAQDVLSVFRKEVGTVEKGTNKTKYGEEYGWNGVAWCVIFQWWGFKHANASELFFGGKKTASCGELFRYHKAKGQQVSLSNLKPGDIVFFDFNGTKTRTDHVGIVDTVVSDGVYSFEGNTSAGSSGSQDNGEGVYRRKRQFKYISCAYRPLYDGVSTIDNINQNTTGYSNESFVRDVQKACGLTGNSIDGEVGPETLGVVPLIKIDKNSTHPAVSVLQVRLFALGYKLPKYGADGDYGSETKDAVMKFQKDHGLLEDGEFGPDSWKMILSI